MKILRLLNKKNFIFFLFFAFLNNSMANEPVDIWNIDKTKNVSENSNQDDNLISEEISQEDTSVFDLNNKKIKNNENEVLLENNFTNIIPLYGLYDPDENNLSIEMWSKSDGKEIKRIFDKIFSQALSQDALDILKVALLTNSNTPNQNITKEEFYNFQKNFLLKNKDLDLIKLFVEKNTNFVFLDDLINYYANYYLAEANIKKSCEIFDSIKEITLKDDYTSKLKIYCLVNSNKFDQAMLIYDLKKENGFKDDFFEKKIFKLIGFETESDAEISDKNLLREVRAFETFEKLILEFFNKKFEKNSFFLELGSGNKNFLKVLENKNFKFKGLDIDDMDFENDKIPLDDATVDFVISNSVIEHIKNDHFFLKEIYRVLKKGAILILITPNFYYSYKNFYDDPTHVNPFTPQKMKSILSIVGMQKTVVLPWLVKKNILFWKLPFKFFISRYLIPFRGDIKFKVPSFLKGKTSSMIVASQK